MTQGQVSSQQSQKRLRKEIVIVEHDDAFADLLREVLWQETSCKIFRVATGAQALRVVPQLRPDLLIVGFQLADMTGMEVFEQLHAIKEFVLLPTILLSTHQLWTRMGSAPFRCIEQPFDVNDLLRTIALALGEDIWTAPPHRSAPNWYDFPSS